MFRLLKLVLHNIDDTQTFSYDFYEGINYFVGKNDSGKTEFYSFIDYMLGSGDNPGKRDWYKDSLLCADLFIKCNEIEFVLTRYLGDQTKNYFRYASEEKNEPIRIDEYKERINQVIAQDEDSLRELRSFVGEDISYRTFTLFNFLGEKRQGILNDFFDKCSKLKYSIKLPAILNYIFNRNLEEIEQLKIEEAELAATLENIVNRIAQNEEIKNRVNRQLEIIGIEKVFIGGNSTDILQAIEDFQGMVMKKDISAKMRTVAELEAVYTSLDEQIKVQLKTEADCNSFATSAEKQKKLLENLQQLIGDTPQYSYLVNPIIQLISELNQSISFNKYLIKESTTKELKKQRKQIRNQILAEQSQYRIYSASEKTKAITLVKDYLSFYDADLTREDEKSIRKRLKEVREKIKHLQNSNDVTKIQLLSNDITALYETAASVSDLVEYDFSKPGFRIEYIKNGNTLQPQISEAEYEGTGLSRNYYTGSMARHTLIQLCGYLAFLRMMIKEKKYPLAPILVIDHISKPFDSKNGKAIGKVFQSAFSDFSTNDLQVFIFDDEEPPILGISPNYTTNLVDDTKSGFNPFYHKPDEQSFDNE